MIIRRVSTCDTIPAFLLEDIHPSSSVITSGGAGRVLRDPMWLIDTAPARIAPRGPGAGGRGRRPRKERDGRNETDFSALRSFPGGSCNERGSRSSSSSSAAGTKLNFRMKGQRSRHVCGVSPENGHELRRTDSPATNSGRALDSAQCCLAYCALICKHRSSAEDF